MTRVFAAALSLALWAPLAGAADKPAQPSAAQQAIDIGREGLALYKRGLWQQAFDRFEQADKLYHSPVFVLHMARCRAKVGALLEARQLFDDVAKETPGAQDTEIWKTARESADAEGKALAQRIPKLKLVVKNAKGGIEEAWVDGRAAAIAELKTGLAVDPGRHTLSARDSGGAKAQTAVSIDEGQVLSVSLDFGRPTPSKPDKARTPELPESRKPVRWPGVVALSVGAAGLTTGIVTGLLAKRDADAVLDGCDENLNCNSADESRVDRGRRYATVSTIGFGVGGALLVTGAALMIWPPYVSTGEDTAIRIAPTLGGAAVGGTF